jgi:hypothetical protein
MSLEIRGQRDDMKLWRKLTFEWPLVLSDWLWVYLGAPLLARLEQLTFRRLVYLAALTLFLIAFLQYFALGDALLFAGDSVLYLEVVFAVTFLAVRVRVLLTLRIVAQKIRAAVQGVMVPRRRYGRIIRQMRRDRGTGGPKDSDDEPAPWLGGLGALA